MKKRIFRTIDISVIMVLLICKVNVFSMDVFSDDDIVVSENEVISDNQAVSDNSVDNISALEESDYNQIISVVLPTVDMGDTYNFFIDPHNILYNTYSDSEYITVEKDAHMLFVNRCDGGYSMSGDSDKLAVINMSTVPVEITVEAYLENIEGINILDSMPIGESNTCDMYLALVDDEGNEYPISADGKVSFTVVLDKASDMIFDSFSIGLTGDCSVSDGWVGIDWNPVIRIEWIVEPVFEIEDADTNEMETYLQSIESEGDFETVSGNVAYESGTDIDDVYPSEGNYSVLEGDSSVYEALEDDSTEFDSDVIGTSNSDETKVDNDNSSVSDNSILKPENKDFEEDDL